MIRTVVLAALALGALATPALAFEHASVASPDANAPHFTDQRMFAGMMSTTTTEGLHFGQPAQDKQTVIYELHPDGKVHPLDLTDPRDNPFMAQPERTSDQSSQTSSGEASSAGQ